MSPIESRVRTKVEDFGTLHSPLAFPPKNAVYCPCKGGIHMEIGIRLHDTAGSNLEEHLRNAREQGFSCVHIAMSKVVPGFKMADAPELLTDALADEVRGLLEKYNQRCVLLGCYLNLCSPDLSAHERTLMNYRAHLRFGKKSAR